MPRPKSNPSAADLEAEITRLQRAQESKIADLIKRKQDVEGAENLRRGELLQRFLAGPHGPELRRVLDLVVAQKDRGLFHLIDRAATEQSMNSDRNQTS